MRALPWIPILTFVSASLAYPAPAEEGWLETAPGVRLRWRALGSGSPTIIVPGGFLFGTDSDALAAEHRVIFYDMRNRGESTRVTDPSMLTMEADVSDLERVREHFDLSSFIPVGYSYLGKMVVLYALGHPGRVERIVQIGPVGMRFGEPFPPVQDNTGEQVMDPVALAAVRELRSRGWHEERPEAYCEREWEVTRVRLVGDPRNARGLESHCSMENEWPVRLAFHLDHHFRSARETHVDPMDLVDLAIPVLTIHGTKDRNAPYGAGREWAATLPNGRLLTSEGAAHQAWVEDPRVVPAIREFAAGRWPAPAEDLDLARETWLSQMRAWSLLRRALERAGSGDAELFAQFTGALHLRSQGPTPEPPYLPFPLQERVAIDSTRRRISIEEELTWPDFVSRSRIVADGDGGFVHDPAMGRVSPLDQEPGEIRLRILERLPHLILATALEDTGALRFAGVERTADGLRSLIEGNAEGVRLTILLDGDARVRSVRRLAADPLLGDTIVETLLSDHADASGREVPSTVSVRSNGALIEQMRLTRLEPRALSADAFARPPGGESSAARVLELEPLAPRVWIVSGIGGHDYRSLVIEKGDGLVVVEAPVGAEAMESVFELLGERFPGRRLTTVIVSHHHYDHSGGAPAALARGARLVTSPGNAAFFRSVARVPRTLDPMPAGEIRSEVVPLDSEVLILPGEGPAVQVHQIDASPHAAEMLFVWLPDEGILFQGDLYVLYPGPPESARDQGLALAAAIDRRGLAVERLLGVHGQAATLEDLRAAIRLRHSGARGPR